MPVLAVTIHDAEGPEARYLALEVLLDTKAVLIDFVCLRNESSACVYAKLLDDVIDSGGTGTSSILVHACVSLFWAEMLNWSFSFYVDSSAREVVTFGMMVDLGELPTEWRRRGVTFCETWSGAL